MNPTTHASSFNGSAPGWTLVDPERYSDGLWVEQATTNLWSVNVGYENGIAGWSTFGDSDGVSVVWSQSSDWAKSGTSSIKVTGTGDTVNDQTTRASSSVTGFTTGEAYTFQGVYNRATSTLWVQMVAQWQNSGGNVGSEVKLAETLAGVAVGDVEFTSTQTCPATADRVRLIWRIRLGVADTIHTFFGDCIGVEHLPYATSYTDGSLGSGYAHTGTAFSSSSTRAASSASISPAGILDPASGSLAFRITPTIETGVEEIWGECGVKGAGTDHLRWGRDASTHPFVEWSSNDAAYQRLTGSETLSAGTAYDLYFGWNGTAIELAVDAGTLQTDTRDAVEGDFSTGDLTLEASAGGAIYQPFATFNRTLTAKEIATLNSKNNWTMKVLAGNPYINFQLRPY